MQETKKILIGIFVMLSFVMIFATPVKLNHEDMSAKIHAASEDKSLVALSTNENKLIIINNKTNQIIPVTNSSISVTAAAFSPTDKKLIYGTVDNNVIIWDIQSKRVEQVINNFSYLDNSEYQDNLADPNTSHFSVSPTIVYVTSLAYSPDERLIAAATTDNSIRIWEVKSEDYRIPDEYGDYYFDDFFMNGMTLKGHKNTVRKLLFDKNSNLLASADDNTIRVWNSFTGKLKQVIPCKSNTELRFTHNKKLYATGMNNQTKYVCTKTNL